MSSGTHNVTEIHGDYTEPYYGVYFQDDYKITLPPDSESRTALGVRERRAWRRTTRFRISTSRARQLAERHGRARRLAVSRRGQCARRQLECRTRKNFAPRFGFAYNLETATVFRGGYGIFYSNSWGNGSNNNAMPQIGFICSTPVATTLDNGLTPYAVLSNPFPTGFCKATGSNAGLLTNLGQSLFILDRNAKQPYVQTWNFDIQRSFPGTPSPRSPIRVPAASI